MGKSYLSLLTDGYSWLSVFFVGIGLLELFPISLKVAFWDIKWPLNFY